MDVVGATASFSLAVTPATCITFSNHTNDLLFEKTMMASTIHGTTAFVMLHCSLELFCATDIIVLSNCHCVIYFAIVFHDLQYHCNRFHGIAASLQLPCNIAASSQFQFATCWTILIDRNIMISFADCSIVVKITLCSMRETLKSFAIAASLSSHLQITESLQMLLQFVEPLQVSELVESLQLHLRIQNHCKHSHELQ